MDIRHSNGIAAELYVSSFLALRGWSVYLPIASQSRSDLIIEKKRRLKRVQVKKLTWSKTGPNRYLSTRLTSRNKYSKPYTKEDFDLVALTDMDKVWLIPIEDLEGMTSIQVGKEGPTIKETDSKWNKFSLN